MKTSIQPIAALVACFLVIALTACGGSSSTTASSGSTDSGGGGSSGGGGGSSGGGGSGGGGGSVTVEKPTITTQPAAQTVVSGASASFAVSATGTAPLSYQWKKNGVDIPGATTSTYTTPATSSADIDSPLAYSVAVSNSAGTDTSTNASLTVTAAPVAPAIDTQPAAQTVKAGQTATFSVTATGTAPLGYQWKKNGSPIDGATASSYTTPVTTSADHGARFSVVLSNSVGTVTSSEASLTVGPAITTQPAALTVAPGKTATFSVTATGTAPLRYQWKKDGTPIDGATASSYPIANASSADDGVYSVVVTDSAGTVTSSNASLTVSRYSLLANASGGTYATTECILDNDTGLVWEGKTASGVRAATNTYTHYDNTASAQKLDGSNPNQGDIDAPSNSIGYVKAVNAIALCGFTDWRLPEGSELLVTMENIYSPSIDSTWFPNRQTNYYWASGAYDSDPKRAEAVTYAFPWGYTITNAPRSNGTTLVRLVRGASANN